MKLKMNLSAEGIITGIGVALAASVLLPVVRSASRPLVASGMQGITLIGNRLKSGVAYMKEEMVDLVAEAQYERMKDSGRK